MRFPLEISFRNMAPSVAIEERLRLLVDRFARVHSQVISCRVMVELMNRRHLQGNLFRVRVDVRVPTAEVVSSRVAGDRHAHEDVYVAIGEAFDRIRRQLDALSEKRRDRSRGPVDAAAVQAPRE